MLFFKCRKENKENKHEVLEEAKQVSKKFKKVVKEENHFTIFIARSMVKDRH